MNEIERAIHCIKADRALELTNHGRAIKYYDLAIEALQEKQEREKGCEYCEWHNDPISRLVWECGLDHFDFELNFCPNCGRKLRPEGSGE